MPFGGRKVAFKALVGSHNYNLNTENSDKDYKVFVFPTFDDLYFNNTFSKSYIGEQEDLDVHDVRKCTSLWLKANVNFLEVLFTDELLINPCLDDNSKKLIESLYEMKNDIAKINLKYLYDACIGMYYNKIKYLEKGTEGTQYLVDKYGYDTKQALHAFRILDFLKRFADEEFNDLKLAIKYEDNDPMKKFLLDIKNGFYSLAEYKDISSRMYDEILLEYKDKYRAQLLNEETNDKILNIIKELVKMNTLK